MRVSCSSKVYSRFMRLIPDRIVSCASCDCGISIFFWTLWNCSCGIRSLLSVLCWTTGIHLFVSESNLRHLDCFVSSPLGLWELSLRRHAIDHNLLDELRLWKFSCFLRRLCVFVWGQLHHCDGLSSKIGSVSSTPTLCSSIHSGVSFVCGQPSSLV